MGKKMISIKTVVAIGIGAALMFVLNRFVTVPTGIPNVNLFIGNAILALFAAIFGPLAGLLVGFIGHTLVDLTWGWGVWWSWVITSGIYGLMVGFFWKFYKIEEGEFGIKQAVIFNGIQIGANLLAWVAIAPTLDILIYQEPADKVYLQGLVAGASNIAVVLILGTLLAIGYSRTRTKAGSLKVE
jgi:energy-coupling factor transport system substrate-specific component